MNQIINRVIKITLIAGITLFTISTANAETLSSNDKASYAIGADFGNKVKSAFAAQDVQLNNKMIVEGLQAALEGKNMRFTQAEMQQILMAFQQDLQKKAQAKSMAESGKNKQDGEAFLKANAKKKGVVSLPSGLQYKILKKGTGKKPAATSKVETHYRGTLLNGKEFDSSYKRKQTVTFPVNGVIKGWTEALQLMPVGSKWQLFIPSDLAYGDRGAGRMIPPGSTLIFEVELLAIK